jgi:hypothetical protein
LASIAHYTSCVSISLNSSVIHYYANRLLIKKSYLTNLRTNSIIFRLLLLSNKSVANKLLLKVVIMLVLRVWNANCYNEITYFICVLQAHLRIHIIWNNLSLHKLDGICVLSSILMFFFNSVISQKVTIFFVLPDGIIH